MYSVTSIGGTDHKFRVTQLEKLSEYTISCYVSGKNCRSLRGGWIFERSSQWSNSEDKPVFFPDYSSLSLDSWCSGQY